MTIWKSIWLFPGFFLILAKMAKERGDFYDSRVTAFTVFSQGAAPGEVFINTSRIIKLSGLSAQDKTMADGRSCPAGRRAFMRFLPKLSAGLSKALFRFASMADVTGVRESRRIHGHYTLTVEDVY